jgi:hypothetical protein
MGKLRWFITGIAMGLTAAAIGQELQKQPQDRVWKGTVAGVPYNFNLAEWRDIASEYWDPRSDEILTRRVVGLGWGVNFAALYNRAQHLIEAQQAPKIPKPVER